MKTSWILILISLLVLSFTGCGTSTVSNVPGASAEDLASNTVVPSFEVSSETVDMLYYKKLGDSAIMAACYTDEGIERMGRDYYVVGLTDAEIYNAAGVQIELSELTRGCPIRITWPGMVMESYPAQIAAVRVDALSDEEDPSVPPEDEIQPIGDGPIWWEVEEETVTEVPDLTLDYRNDMYATHCIIPPRSGLWCYSEEDSGVTGGADNAVLSGLPVQDWTFDDNNTMKRSGFDTITLSTAPDYSTITVTAYAYGDETDQGVVVVPDEEGTLTLLDGNCIYVVQAEWNDGQYQGSATYGFLVLGEETP